MKARRVIYYELQKKTPKCPIQFLRVTLYKTTIQQNQAKFNQLIKREAKYKI